jgi:hypothetical protein
MTPISRAKNTGNKITKPIFSLFSGTMFNRKTLEIKSIFGIYINAMKKTVIKNAPKSGNSTLLYFLKIQMTNTTIAGNRMKTIGSELEASEGLFPRMVG